MKKMWKRQEFPEEKENTGCEEIKRVKKNETTKQRKRNVTITGRNVQLWNKFTELILLHWINGWIGWTVSGSSSEVPHPEPGSHWAGREIYPGPQSAALGTVPVCWSDHSSGEDLNQSGVGTGSQGSCSRRDNTCCLAGGCRNCIGGKDVETVSPVAAEGLKATVVWPVLESVVIKSPPGLLIAQDYPYSESCLLASPHPDFMWGQKPKLCVCVRRLRRWLTILDGQCAYVGYQT